MDPSTLSLINCVPISSPPRILVVDDDEDVADFVSTTLNTLGYKCDICTNAATVGNIYSIKHAVIVLDIFMPQMDGIEVLRFLHESKVNIAIVLMSGKDKSVLHSARELATEWGFSVLGMLEKPFTSEDLGAVFSEFAPSEKVFVPNNPPVILEDDISRAIELEQLTLSYQPKIRLADGVVQGVEALIRWEHPEKGFISPSIFIPVAELVGQIEPINQFVVRSAVAQMNKWLSDGLDFSLSINISPASIANLHFPEQLEKLAIEADISPSKITIEVTETAIMSNVGNYMDMFTRLRMKGFRLAIDDFGTGYSSLYQLVRLPFTEIKVDQAFVSNILKDRECATVTLMATILAHELGMNVVAEGVEDEETMDMVQKIGCDEVQGFFCARPMKAAILGDWLNERKYKFMNKNRS